MSKHDPGLLEGVALSRANGLVLVSNTAKGRGVFASDTIPVGKVIDVCPVLIFDDAEVAEHTSKTCLAHYTYYWPSKSGRTMTQALALGLGSMFNHSIRKQNVGWSRDLETECITYVAIREIQKAEELCISYGSGRLWFDDADQDGETEDHTEELEVDRGETLGELELSGLSGIDV